MPAPSIIGLALALSAAPPAAPTAIHFEDVTKRSGLRFTHRNGGTGERYFIETMGSGVCAIDYDRDGLLDLYFVQGAPTAGGKLGRGPGNELWRNQGAGRFVNVTGRAGVAHGGYDMGCTVGDYDNDGWPDLFVTGFGANALFHNRGDGTFADVTLKAGVGAALWSTAAAFGDLDGDGALDIFVANYVDFGFKNHKFCGDLKRGLREYCHPDVYNGLAAMLYHNNQDGTFTDVAKKAGVWTTEGKGLGVVMSDFDNDGDLDVYVANDSTIHHLWLNNGDGTFANRSLESGAGFDENGAALAGMGVDAGDVDGDGDLDLFVTNLDMETNTLYENVGKARFRDVGVASGLGLPSLLLVGFGAALADLDDDGDLDVLVANGHILDNVALFKDNVSYAQPMLVHENRGGRFTDVSAEAGSALRVPRVGRGLALVDLDNDGDLDAVMTANNGPAVVFENRSAPSSHVLLVRLVGTRSNRDGIGARLELKVGGQTLVREAKSASSYLSQGDPRLHFGLGAATRAESLSVRWPSGVVDRLEGLEGDRLIVVREGKGLEAARPLAHR